MAPELSRDPPSMFGVGKSIQKEISYAISHKHTEDLSISKGSIKDFEPWAKKMIRHLKGATVRNESLLADVRKSTTGLRKEMLVASEIEGFNAWEISTELGRFTKKFLSSEFTDEDSFYTLCGGDDENGFEMWRNLQLQYGGGRKVVEVSGIRNFLSYPRCHTESGLVKHLNAWEKALAKYGQGLLQTPETLRILVLGILPKALETKLTHVPRTCIRQLLFRFHVHTTCTVAFCSPGNATDFAACSCECVWLKIVCYSMST